MRKLRTKGPAKMPKGYEGKNGFEYHSTKGFRRSAGFEQSVKRLPR